MPYLIDGNNLLGVVLHRRRGDPETRSRLVSSLSRFARTKGCRILLFFDGPKEYDLFPLASDLELFFSQEREADELILETLESSRNWGETLLVSADRELINYARGRKVSVLSPRSFFDQLLRFERGALVDAKPEPPLSERDLLQWQRLFSRQW
ncbi:MAG TPA: NYN domain-containing protein [Candidatus Aminicenantes bacterium]|nr:NYN domain-containing protein [Candidatus Aminicenantes bacterium]HPB54841.1 NYN domain-containing protein [Candidatus Aminicenantes bacterium]HPS99092.1 NYN domain-containing protein [Candidatus Aminicenantes bacterium]